MELKDSKAKRDFYTIGNGICLLYLALMLLLFPLYSRDKYFDILQARFDFFWICSSVFSVLLFAFVALYSLTLKKEERKEILPSLFWKKEAGKKKPLFATDLPFCLLILLFFLSMFLSGYPYETWWGSTGRYMGVLTWLLFFTVYLGLSRFYRFKKFHLLLFSVGVVLQCLWGISDFYMMNYMHFFDNVSDLSKWAMFAGPVGNINGYTSLVLFYACLYTGLYLQEKELRWKHFFMGMMLLCHIATIFGSSDNAVIGYFFVFLVLPFFSWKDNKSFGTCLSVYFLFFLSLKLSVLLAGKGQSILQISPPGFLFSMGKTILPYLGMGLTGILWALGRFSKKELSMKLFKRLYVLLLILFFMAGAYVIYDVNVMHRYPALEQFSQFLRFDDSWGTGRGFIWRMGMEYFRDKMPMLKRLFGYGPDGYFMLTNDNYKVEGDQAGMGLIDSIHNEYLNLLLTIGVFGLLAYLYFLKNVFTVFWKKETENVAEATFRQTAFPFAVSLAYLAYLVQASINIAVPIVMPIVMIVTFLGVSGKRAE